MEYADGTSLEWLDYPFAGSKGKGRALCPDGTLRAFTCTDADTFFSCPARVSAQGTTVTGYVTVETRDGYTTETDDDPAVVRFIPYLYRKNYELVGGTTDGR